MQKTEEQLIQDCLAGNVSAFADLYDAYVKRIYSYHYYRTFHAETAEDLTSQTFINALEKLKSFDPEKGAFSAWLYRIARNILIDHVRKIKPSVDIEDVWNVLVDRTNISKDAEHRERLEQVQKLLQELPSDQRDVVVMRLWDELSYAEIAQLTGKSEAACKMTVSRALSIIKKHAPVLALFLFIRGIHF